MPRPFRGSSHEVSISCDFLHYSWTGLGSLTGSVIHILTPTACLLHFICHLYLDSSAFPTLGFQIFPLRWVASPSSNPNLQYRGLIFGSPLREATLCITKNWEHFPFFLEPCIRLRCFVLHH